MSLTQRCLYAKVYLKQIWPWLLVVLALGAYLRLDDYGTLLRFNADQVRDIKIVAALTDTDANWPLLGPKAGGTAFQLGPAFYYLEYISGKLFGFTPVGTTLLIPLLAILALGLLYTLFRLVVSTRIALLLTTLAASSAYLIKYSRFGWNPNFILFFWLSFYIALLHILDPEEKRPRFWYAIAGLSMGIGMQLHTITLLLMPCLLAFVFGWRCWRNRHPTTFHGLLLASLIILGCFFPVIRSEITTDWSNTRAFFTGIGAKTEDKATNLNPALVTFDFFLQGTAALLTGYEPRGQWINPDAWKKAFTPINTCLFFFSLGVTLSGMAYMIQKLRSPSTPMRERRFFALATVTLILTLLLFLLIGNELNLRFFMLLAFFPLLFLGLTLSAFEESVWARRFANTPFIMCLLLFSLLGVSNLTAYRTTYDFSHSRSFTKAYGGISLGEATALAETIQHTLKQHPEYPSRLTTFEYERSLQYLLDPSDIKLRTTKENTSLSEGRFLILSREELDTLDTATASFIPQRLTEVGRYQLFWLLPKPEYEIN